MTRPPTPPPPPLPLTVRPPPALHFPSPDAFQQWDATVLHAGPADAFINVPITELPGEYLVVRPSAVKGIRVEPVFGALDDDDF